MNGAFYDLPMSLNVDGTDHPIRADYRAVLTIMSALRDPDMSAQEKSDFMGLILFQDWDQIKDRNEAIKQAVWFIDCGQEWKSKPNAPVLMDWQQDWHMIAPACNRVAGQSIRQMAFLHWWDFIGLYQEIGECTFSTVVGIRDKIAHHKKLEKWEQEFKREHSDILYLRKSADEDAADLLEKIREGGVIGIEQNIDD